MIPQISIIDIIRVERRDFSLKTVNKSCFVISCRVKGESLFSCNDRQLTVKRGDILYIPEKSTYWQRCDHEELVCFHLQIAGGAPEEMQVFSTTEGDEVCALFLRAEALWRERSERYEYRCMAILYELLSRLTDFTVPVRESKASPLALAMAYLDTHLCDADLSLDAVCRAAHMSRTYFNKLFRERYGVTPMAYIHARRIERAKALLVSGSLSNEEIAALCGFEDVKYFYVVFKKQTGYTTGGYKRAVLEG